MATSEDEYFSCEEEENLDNYPPVWENRSRIGNSQCKSLPANSCQNSQTTYDIKQRKFIDLSRLYCISRPQYLCSCGISSVASVFNYLYSNLGSGDQPPLTQEQIMTALGFQPPLCGIRFGRFTNNATVIGWFQNLCHLYKVDCEVSIIYQPIGHNRTTIASKTALQTLIRGLQSKDRAFIYHCYCHYFCPIGFEIDADKPSSAYDEVDDSAESDTWIYIGDTNKKYCPVHSVKWVDIVEDLQSPGPERINIRKMYEGKRIQHLPRYTSAQSQTTISKPVLLSKEIRNCNIRISNSHLNGENGKVHAQSNEIPREEIKICRACVKSDGIVKPLDEHCIIQFKKCSF